MAGLLVLIAPVILALFTVWMETLESKVLYRGSDTADAGDTGDAAAGDHPAEGSTGTDPEPRTP